MAKSSWKKLLLAFSCIASFGSAAEDVKLLLPEKIYAVPGVECNIYQEDHQAGRTHGQGQPAYGGDHRHHRRPDPAQSAGSPRRGQLAEEKAGPGRRSGHRR